MYLCILSNELVACLKGLACCNVFLCAVIRWHLSRLPRPFDSTYIRSCSHNVNNYACGIFVGRVILTSLPAKQAFLCVYIVHLCI